LSDDEELKIVRKVESELQAVLAKYNVLFCHNDTVGIVVSYRIHDIEL
jgi:hypothetical protein